MVYLRDIILHKSKLISQYNNIETVVYYYFSDKANLEQNTFDLTNEETFALNGYLSIDVDKSEIKKIIEKPAVKGINAISNIFKLSGLYLLSKDLLKEQFYERFYTGDIKDKYFMSKIEPKLKSEFLLNLKDNTDNISVLLKRIFYPKLVLKDEVDNALISVTTSDFDIQTLLILEELEKSFLKVKYISKNAEEILRDIFHNFPNAIQKIIKNRRLNHKEFVIKDEYDVQDILYVIIKAVFPNMRDEDPIPKVGAKSSRIDLILREEKVLIEVKMIKEKDRNENHFIEQLKVDFESYHECKWLDKLFCFVYDPEKKTKDISNFNDLNGLRTKGQHTFDVEVIVVN